MIKLPSFFPFITKNLQRFFCRPSLYALFVRTIAAAISGYFAIRLMLRLIREKSLLGFGVYTAILGVLVLADQLIFNQFFANPFI